MKAFDDEFALELGRSILERFEEGINGKKWEGAKVVLPITLAFTKGIKSLYPHETPWSSAVELQIPYFFRYHGPFQPPEHITLNEWLEEVRRDD